MGWTPPSKLMVFITFLCMAFGIFILLDTNSLFWTQFLPPFNIGTYDGWFIITLALFFLTWFLFFLAVKLKGL